MTADAKTLLLGYGNADRQDDGVAWHILAALAARLGSVPPPSPEDGLEITTPAVDLLFQLQLTPELSELVSSYARAGFIDAHTGRVEADIHFSPISPAYQTSPFTHHMTPETLLAICQAIEGHAPDSVLVSVRGYEFGFEHELSQSTAALAQEAVQRIWDWLSL